MDPPDPAESGSAATGALFAFTDDDGPVDRARGGRRRLLLLAGGATVMLVAAGLVLGYVAAGPLVAPDDYAGAGSGTVVVEITPGATAGDVAGVLARADVVASAGAFVRAVEGRGKAESLRPGRYRLRHRMAAGSALDLLLSPGARVRRRVTVPEGLRAGETLARLARLSGLPADGLARAAADRTALDLPPYAAGAAEGFLFPATYDIEPGTTPRGLLGSMVRRFRRAAADVGLEAGAARNRLTPRQAVVLASIVQAEGGRESDYPKIARVIYNRLAARARLEMDSTVMYGLGRHGIVASAAEIKRDTPYNTYLHTGLPPGPIGNPGESALRAAIQPAVGDWYWFVTIDPARRITKFTNKESEFVRFRQELNRHLGRQ
ncbi:endolytic transglycosylase MltG [Sphaerisporangium rufum]|uniref:endolytic transglycosylase MltG n=1 Tax=Sphaerisporangium rufum TaxID=1381558 RepID=UPI00195059CB|nr:endolytic transglycosylase MltG [Sphaerisporangium rufum]